MKPAIYFLNWWMHISIDKKNHIQVNRENLFSSNIIDTHAKLLSHVWLFVTPRTVAHQAPLSMEFSWQGYWNGLPFPSEGDLPEPGIELASPELQVHSFTAEPSRKPNKYTMTWKKKKEKKKLRLSLVRGTQYLSSLYSFLNFPIFSQIQSGTSISSLGTLRIKTTNRKNKIKSTTKHYKISWCLHSMHSYI